ncbi:MAG: SPOR domain-containing protein [Myxococcales bacterium]|nr:SPOR domain-containing protein [Myxococcales bacterium]
MRDVHKLRERDAGPEDEGWRRAAMWGLGAVALAVLVAGMASMIDKAGAPQPEAPDPLARLDVAIAAEASRPKTKGAPGTSTGAGQPDGARRPAGAVTGGEGAAGATLSDRDLTFRRRLLGEERPEVAAALAAAAAEYEHLDPVAMPTHVDAQDAAAALPAGVAAGPDAEALARSAAHDPLLAAALPARRGGQAATPGQDGTYTLQVISYPSARDARAFAAALRTRGHHAFVLPATIEGRGTVYRVRIGPFPTKHDANAYRERFEREEGMNTYVVVRHGS